MKHQYEFEEDCIYEAYKRGEITLKQYNDELRDLQRDYTAAAQESAREAYEREMERW